MASFAIICEGISENLTLQYIVEKTMKSEFYFADIQPRTAINHGRAVQEGSGGWTEVLSHCNTEEFKLALQSNDYLIVQIDTDRCDDPKFGVKKLDDNNDPRHESEIYDDIVHRLLLNVDREFYEANKNRIIFAICFEEIECWFLPLFFNDKRACATIGCINKINQELHKEKGGYNIPEDDKNSTRAYGTYRFILRKLKRKDIPKVATSNFGFQMFVEQLDNINDHFEESEE